MPLVLKLFDIRDDDADLMGADFYQKGLPKRIVINAYPFTLGRGKEVNCSLDSQWRNKSVSRLHARIVDRDEAIRIEDCESVNGIMVNFSRVSTAQIHDGDVISIGGSTTALEGEQCDKPWARTDVHYRVCIGDEKGRVKKRAAGDADASEDSDSARHISPVAQKILKRRKKKHVKIYNIGQKVEGKSTNVSTGEVNAWFTGHIRSFNEKSGKYEIQWWDEDKKKSHTSDFNEMLPVERLRPDTGDSNWKFRDLYIDQLVEILDERGWWYDALIKEKLGDPTKIGETQPCIRITFVDHPNYSPDKSFSVAASKVYIPALSPASP